MLASRMQLRMTVLVGAAIHWKLRTKNGFSANIITHISVRAMGRKQYFSRNRSLANRAFGNWLTAK